MKIYLIKLFGLKGSWKWACKKMSNGSIVWRKNQTGTVKYKVDSPENGRIVWTFENNPLKNSDWKKSNIFLSDFDAIDWCVCNYFKEAATKARAAPAIENIDAPDFPNYKEAINN